MKSLFAVLSTSFAILATGLPVFAATVSPGSGATFHQIDFTFAGASQADSDYGMLIVDFTALAAATGISDGYLNVYTLDGWVIQNMPIYVGSGLPGYGTMFDLNSGGDVTSISALVDLSAAPVTTFGGVPSTVFPVAALEYNAEGFAGIRPSPPAQMSLLGLGWIPGAIERWWQSVNPSIEQDVNQCLPASVANSFQWLENEYGINVPHEHVPGIGDNSLVGELDKDTGRAPHQPVGGLAGLNGKLQYLDDNGLGNELDIKHKNRTGGNMLPNNDVTVGGTTSEANTAAISLIDWICEEIAHGEDVELGILWDGGGGHFIRVVGCGKLFGVPWISWVHDANQGFDANGAGVADDTTAANGGNGLLDGGFGWSPIVNGKVMAFPFGFTQPGTLEIAYSESPVPPELLPSLSEWGMVLSVSGLLISGTLVMLWKRQQTIHASG